MTYACDFTSVFRPKHELPVESGDITMKYVCIFLFDQTVVNVSKWLLAHFSYGIIWFSFFFFVQKEYYVYLLTLVKKYLQCFHHGAFFCFNKSSETEWICHWLCISWVELSLLSAGPHTYSLRKQCYTSTLSIFCIRYYVSVLHCFENHIISV